MPLHVHLPETYGPDNLTLLRGFVADDVHITAGEDVVADCDILVTGLPSAAQIDAAPRLRAVIVPFTGVPPKTLALLRRYPHIDLHNLHYNVVPTAEMALALLFAATKFIVPMDRELRAGDWRARYNATPVSTFNGKTALILGYGQIGQYLAPALLALGMTVIGVRREPPAVSKGSDVTVYPPGALPELLPRADFLINALPLTHETRGIIGAAELALLPSSAVVVNIGRGQTMDEEALYLALRDGVIRAAGIDVWYTYPQEEADRTHTMPSDFPFHELDNVVMSPHRAGYLSAAEADRMAHLAGLLNAAARGEPMPSRVNKELGY